jgi:hypothetical protein
MGKKAFEFRTFHYLNVNLSKQSAALIGDMETELKSLRSKLGNTPAGKRIVQE